MEQEGYFVLSEGSPFLIYCNISNRLTTLLKKLFDAGPFFFLCVRLILREFYIKRSKKDLVLPKYVSWRSSISLSFLQKPKGWKQQSEWSLYEAASLEWS
jgi:hypothetical protein